ncbi:hypothetical protein FJ251_06130 [bacterium]|nr:hypothetical protein [bacterium]
MRPPAWRSAPLRLASLMVLAGLLGGPGSASSARAGEAGVAPAAPDSTAALHGKNARRADRFKRLVANFKGDRLAIYQQYGYPAYRYFELKFSTRTEHWIYLVEDLEFVFEGDRLVARQ